MTGSAKSRVRTKFCRRCGEEVFLDAETGEYDCYECGDFADV